MSAIQALDEHLAARRLDPAEHELRQTACQSARTRSELLELFVDLPAPHPEFAAQTEAEADEDLSPLGAAVVVVLVLGLPVTVVLGVIYGTWWSLTVPVAVAVAMLFTEHLLTRNSDRNTL